MITSGIDTKVNQLFGRVSSMETLLYKYPQLASTYINNIASGINSTSGKLDSISLSLDLLALIGVTKQELADWLFKLLQGNSANGATFIDNAEKVVKSALIGYFDAMMSCSTDPMISDDLMDKFYPKLASGEKVTPTEAPIMGKGVTVNVEDIDPFGTLKICPVQKTTYQDVEYKTVFAVNHTRLQEKINNLTKDGKWSLYNNDDGYNSNYNTGLKAVLVKDKGMKTIELGKYYYGNIPNGRTPSNLYKDRDMNAFMWYVINFCPKPADDAVGTTLDSSIAYWDNRNLQYQSLNKVTYSVANETADSTGADYYDNNFWAKFYQGGSGDTRKTICRLEYNTETVANGGELTVYVSPMNYYKAYKSPLDLKAQRGILSSASTLYFNKTLFAFHNDYIQSLKIFDANVIIGELANSLTGALNLQVNYSITAEIIKGYVSNVIKNIMETDDTDIETCYYTFSNNDYNTMLTDAQLKRSGLNKIGNTVTKTDINAILSSMTGNTNSGTAQQSIENVKKILTQINASGSKDDSVETNGDLSLQYSTMKSFLNTIVASMVASLISPKLMLLFKMDSEIMGDKFPSSINDILKFLGNLIIKVALEIKKLVVAMLLKWITDIIVEWLSQIEVEFTLEQIMDLRDLLENLLLLAKQTANRIAGTTITGDNTIDNVDYADITTQTTSPKTDNC